MRCRVPLLVHCIMLGLTMTAVPTALANPSSQTPTQGLSAHGTIEGAKELAEQLYHLYDEEAKFVDQTYAHKDDPSTFSARQISKSAGRLWKAQRDAKRLQTMGEPAGFDLFKKLRLLDTEVYRFGQSYQGTLAGQQLVQRIQAKLQREKPQMQRFLQQAGAALEKGKLEVFEVEMEKKGQVLAEQLVFFNAAGSRSFDEEFNTTLAKGDALLARRRAREYANRASQIIREQLAITMAFGGEGKRIAREIANRGTAQLQNGTIGGPVESFAHVGSLWGAASAALIRAHALRWAFPSAKIASEVDSSQLKQTALATLVLIVESAARSTSTEDVQDVYSGLLESISSIDRRMGVTTEEVRRACDEAMRNLAMKDPDLPVRLDAYERATAEVLQWRQAFASQQATHLGREVSRSGALLSRKAATEIRIRPPYARVAVHETSAAPHLFSDPADWMVQEAAARLVGQRVIEDRAIRPTPSSQVAIIPLGHSHYANLPVPLASDAQVSDLFSALVVNEVHRPLTIEAADAVSAANSQDYETVMSQIDEVHIESIVTKMIGLPDVDYPIVNLGQPVGLYDQLAPIEQTCWRMDLRPLWARHLHFIVRTDHENSR